MARSFVMDSGRLVPGRSRRRVLITGAAGNIGSHLAREAREHHELTLMIRPGDDASAIADCGQVVAVELADLPALKQALAGIDTVVHLAADPDPSAPWASLLQDNIIGTYHAFVAAHAAGCRRVIFASSIHAVSAYPQDVQVHPHDPVNPGDIYGVSKCFGEALARYMASEHGLSSIVLRIGAFQDIEAARTRDLRLIDAFVSKRDLAQLILRCIDDEHLRFAIFHGLSANRFNRMDISTARELVGYVPQDDFTAENPLLRDLHLGKAAPPHDERHGQRSGLRDSL